jgi:hypothetical protein
MQILAECVLSNTFALRLVRLGARGALLQEGLRARGQKAIRFFSDCQTARAMEPSLDSHPSTLDSPFSIVNCTGPADSTQLPRTEATLAVPLAAETAGRTSANVPA